MLSADLPVADNVRTFLSVVGDDGMMTEKKAKAQHAMLDKEEVESHSNFGKSLADLNKRRKRLERVLKQSIKDREAIQALADLEAEESDTGSVRGGQD